MLIMLLLMPVVNEGEFVCQALHFFCVIVISHTVGNLNHIGNLTLKPGSSQLLSKAVAQSCQGDFSLQRFFCNMPRARGTAISLLGCSFVVWTCPMQAATPSEWQVHHWHFYKYSCEKWWKQQLDMFEAILDRYKRSLIATSDPWSLAASDPQSLHTFLNPYCPMSSYKNSLLCQDSNLCNVCMYVCMYVWKYVGM